MDREFLLGGVLYLEWQKNGVCYSAVKEQVEILGKECFEADLEDFCNEMDLATPEGVTYGPEWQPTLEQIKEAAASFDEWLRNEEIM